LKAIVAQVPSTGTLFGLDTDVAAGGLWQNQIYDSDTAYWTASTSAFAQADHMFKVWTYCGRLAAGGTANRYPDLGLCSEGFYEKYHNGCVKSKIHLMMNQETADMGFPNLKYMGMTLISDYDMPMSDAPTNTEDQCYFLNSRFLALKYYKSLNFKTVEEQATQEQFAFFSRIYWMGELITTNRAKQGLLFGVKAGA
jgi:hypothetical protein